MDAKTPIPFVDKVDTSYLESLMGYNSRRAALVIIEVFLERMAVYDLRPVDFSVLSLVTHNPGITSRQLCSTLGIQAPNLVGMVNAMEKRALIVRRPHPHDGRAMGLHPTPTGEEMMREAEKTAAKLEIETTSRLNTAERKTLMQLLKKIYK
nr:MarR family winged helix-turn-helix transcriptional regulator [Rhodoferax ferrireducens]